MIENELDITENPIKLKVKIRDTFFSFYNNCLDSFRFVPFIYNFFSITTINWRLYLVSAFATSLRRCFLATIL